MKRILILTAESATQYFIRQSTTVRRCDKSEVLSLMLKPHLFKVERRRVNGGDLCANVSRDVDKSSKRYFDKTWYAAYVLTCFNCLFLGFNNSLPDEDCEHFDTLWEYAKTGKVS